MSRPLWIARRTAAVLRREGAAGTIRRIVKHARIALGITSSEVRRYRQAKAQADLRFDTERGVDTGGTQNLGGLTIPSPNASLGVAHIATVPGHFHRALGLLDIDPKGCTFVDLGAGKGRALLMAADYPFAAIVGVEFAHELYEICERNLARTGDPRITCLLQDAEAFAYPATDLVIYMNNPFDAPLVERVARRLEAAFRSDPRTVRLVYTNPNAAWVFAHQPWFSVASDKGAEVFGLRA
ncbi:cyclopropane-fatty-acyl-phospholipid synthase family protein [Parafrankia sp. BMG5.11]|uniref:SAM-dependent methyltransferase n=1 Tax=Parafrankia sp. BMG5.11 TaxID=222540 RepID=UPI0010391A26|nr:methyltransferase domain-containing protein [Parafrankia sp. BMG5.11]TCJ38377.1 methyltransferase domain-containing protein [Parafrankia sp. BMG5.11]